MNLRSKKISCFLLGFVFITGFTDNGNKSDNIGNIDLLLNGDYLFEAVSFPAPKPEKMVNNVYWKFSNGKMQYIYENIKKGKPVIAATQSVYTRNLPYADCVAININPRTQNTASEVIMTCIANQDFVVDISNDIEFSRMKGEIFGFRETTHRGKVIAKQFLTLKKLDFDSLTIKRFTL